MTGRAPVAIATETDKLPTRIACSVYFAFTCIRQFFSVALNPGRIAGGEKSSAMVSDY